MLDLQGLIDLAPSINLTHIETARDMKESISSKVIRGIYDGQRAAAVTGPTTLMTGGLLDLLHLHQTGGNTYAGQHVAKDDVTFIVAEDPTHPEGLDAVRTLAASLFAGPRVNLLTVDDVGVTSVVEPRLLEVSDVALYPGWPDLVIGVGAVPEPVARLINAVGRSELRAYPQLTAKGEWSLRMEGLQVGRFAKHAITLGVGKPGQGGLDSAPRKLWQKATGHLSPLVLTDADEVDDAVKSLRAFADIWVPARNTLTVDGKHEEHALESRVLRGLVPITPFSGSRLDLLDPGASIGGAHGDLANWGSQFPTKWGRGGSARYLDALLRDGTTPWALELKADLGAGPASYYRHAVGQAVLYRHFIQNAAPLNQWFDRYGLDRTSCRAGVVLPELQAKHAMWKKPQQRMCDAFGVELFWVSRDFAALHTMPPHVDTEAA